MKFKLPFLKSDGERLVLLQAELTEIKDIMNESQRVPTFIGERRIEVAAKIALLRYKMDGNSVV